MKFEGALLCLWTYNVYTFIHILLVIMLLPPRLFAHCLSNLFGRVSFQFAKVVET